MIPQRLPNPAQELVTPEIICGVAGHWGITTSLASALTRARAQLPFDLSVFSGARSREHQERLEAEGKPTAPFDVSTHADEDARGCPRLATGVDMWPTLPGVRLSSASVLQLGAAAVAAGLRWGGGSSVDRETGIPADTWHFDEGPR